MLKRKTQNIPSPGDVTKIKSTDLNKNEHLFTEAELKRIQQHVDKQSEKNFKLTKEQLGPILGYSPDFSVAIFNGKIHGIYHGAKQSLEIGSGASGLVKFSVTERESSTELRAIKVIDCSSPLSGNLIQVKKDEAEKEAQALIALGKSQGYFLHSNKIFIDMEYYQGAPLEKIEFISLAHAVDAASNITAEVKNIFDLGCYHYDLKPANILYDQNKGEAHIVDFGSCEKMTNEKTLVKKNTMGASPLYLASEHLKKFQQQKPGEYVFNEKTKVYTLGLTLAEMLKFFTYSANEDAETTLEKISSLQQGKGYSPSKLASTEQEQIIEEELFKLIVSMMNPDPEKRPGLEKVELRLTAIKNMTETKIKQPQKDKTAKEIEDLKKDYQHRKVNNLKSAKENSLDAESIMNKIKDMKIEKAQELPKSNDSENKTLKQSTGWSLFGKFANISKIETNTDPKSNNNNTKSKK